MLLGNSKFKNFFKNKKILITGNTGFKGSWLSFFLINLEATVYGYSINIPTKPSLYKLLKLDKNVKTTFGDVGDYTKFSKTINKLKPDIIFHLAAQSLVFESYKQPYNTFLSNSLGTINLLEILSNYRKKNSSVIITSDKCYDPSYKNIFNENDRLGGIDPYSASKACAEIIYKSYYYTKLKYNKNSKSCTVRAGNVIGGGDWSKNRLFPDVINFINKGKNVIIRNPYANRPWQHVFEPILGYIILSMNLYDGKLNGESFNIGPSTKKNVNVLNLIKKIILFSRSKSKIQVIKNRRYKETNQLNLDTKKIKNLTKWKKVLNLDETLKLIVDWNFYYKNNKEKLKEISLEQVKFFLSKYKDN